jgi:hypothetical protein
MGENMFLHIGADEVVFLNDVIAIIDIERTTTSNTTREFLKSCEKRKITRTVGTDIPKSFIVTEKDGVNGCIFRQYRRRLFINVR